MPSASRPGPEFVDELLALPTPERQAALLRAAGLLNADGLDRLLDGAARLVHSDPGKTQRLATICADLADLAAAPAAVPRADYIRAETYGLSGEFHVYLRLTQSAYDGYVALGKNLEALRTNVGKMAALLELGHYREALDAGQVVLDTLDGKGELDVTPTRSQASLLTALVHQNLGGCYEYMGRYDEALDAYATAEEAYRALGMTEHLGQIIDNRGAILSLLGRGTEALTAHEAAANIFEEAGLTLSQAKALGNIGETCLQLGDYRLSLEAFEKARSLLSSIDALAEEYFLLRNTADSYLALNLYSEALATYREVDSALGEAGMAHERARALWGMGSALVARSELETAEEALAEAAKLFTAAGNTPLLSGVMLEQASLLEARGDREAALTVTRRALELVSERDWPVQAVYAHLRLVDLLLPEVTEAATHLREAQRLADLLALPQLRYRLNERLGRLRRLQGRDEEARVLLEAAVDEIERLRGTVAQEKMRASFLQDKTVAYEDLLRLHLARGSDKDLQLAITVAERAKSRALVDLLTGVVRREAVAVGDPGTRARIQNLQADLDATYNQVLGCTGGSDHDIPLPDLHDRAVELEEEISLLRLQAATASPDPFAASVPREDIREQLPSDVTLLAYHVVGDEILAFVSVHGRVRVVRRLGTVHMVRQLLRRLETQWDRVRVGREFAGRHMALLERSTRRVLSGLYDELVASVEGLLGEIARSVSGGADSPPKLAVVPHGPLHQVPFHALFDGEKYLIERFEISYAPSATVYVLCQERQPRDSNSALVMGVDDPLIPAAMAEARTVAGCFSEAELRAGESATVTALRRGAPERGSLHLACHGLFRADNPMFSSLKLQDGWLMAADAMDLDLAGALVVLSACESGRSEVIGGDEVLGLVRAFLGAGAATLVVSQWLVQDETTAALMEGWYGRLDDGMERSTALRAAQLEIKERHPHPYYWAPFVLIGKR